MSYIGSAAESEIIIYSRAANLQEPCEDYLEGNRGARLPFYFPSSRTAFVNKIIEDAKQARMTVL